MKTVTIDRNDPAQVNGPLAESAPPTADRHTQRILMNVFGRCFELRSHVEIREITKGPAKVIEMPRRSAI